MPITARQLALSLVPVFLLACAVDATPEASTSAPAPAEAPGSTSEAICGKPLVPAATGTMNPSCSVLSTVTYTTTSGYTTANCTGRAGILATTPAPLCLASGYYPDTEWSVSSAAGQLANVSHVDCEASYMDYTLSGLSRTTGTWDAVRSERIYGVWSANACTLFPNTYPQTSGIDAGRWSEVELTAAAYRHVSLLFGAGLFTPMNVTMTIRQGFDWQ